MALGDKFVVAPTSVADAGSLLVRPGAGAEAVIHNLLVPAGTAAGLDLELYDGSNSIVIEEDLSTSLVDWTLHVTNSVYLRLVNNTGGPLVLAATGVVTKE